MRTDPERTVLDEIAAVDPDLAIAIAYETIDCEAEAYAKAMGLPDVSALDLF